MQNIAPPHKQSLKAGPRPTVKPPGRRPTRGTQGQKSPTTSPQGQSPKSSPTSSVPPEKPVSVVPQPATENHAKSEPITELSVSPHTESDDLSSTDELSSPPSDYFRPHSPPMPKKPPPPSPLVMSPPVSPPTYTRLSPSQSFSSEESFSSLNEEHTFTEEDENFSHEQTEDDSQCETLSEGPLDHESQEAPSEEVHALETESPSEEVHALETETHSEEGHVVESPTQSEESVGEMKDNITESDAQPRSDSNMEYVSLETTPIMEPPSGMIPQPDLMSEEVVSAVQEVLNALEFAAEKTGQAPSGASRSDNESSIPMQSFDLNSATESLGPDLTLQEEQILQQVAALKSSVINCAVVKDEIKSEPEKCASPPAVQVQHIPQEVQSSPDSLKLPSPTVRSPTDDTRRLSVLEREISQLKNANETTTQELQLQLGSTDGVGALQSVSRNVCAFCGHRVLVGPYFDVGGGKRVHVECFKCAKCQEPLTSFRYIDGAYLCPRCAHEQRPPATCVACGETIVGSEPIVALNAEWHRTCFRCAQCRRQLTNDFVELHGRPYCPPEDKPCYRIAQGKICCVCSNVLDASYLTVFDRFYHRTCFCCSGCGVPFPSLEFFQINKQPYCETCATQIIGDQIDGDSASTSVLTSQ